MKIPAAVVEVRKELCTGHKCSHTPDYSDPCAACPDGHWGAYSADCLKVEPPPAPSLGLGDIVERLAKPIARALRLSCLDDNHQLRPESPCAKRRDALNALTRPHSQK